MNLTCSKCKETKDTGLFHKNKAMVNGFHNHCKDCRKGVDADKKRQAYYDNKEKYDARAKSWKEDNREQWNAYMVDITKEIALLIKLL